MAHPADVRIVRSDAPFAQTLQRLKDEITGHGLALLAEVDHGGAARHAGLEMPNTVVVLFGNPRAGTPLMLESPDIALDLPLRVLVRESADATELLYHDPGDLAATYGVESLATNIAGIAHIVSAAAGASS